MSCFQEKSWDFSSLFTTAQKNNRNPILSLFVIISNYYINYIYSTTHISSINYITSTSYIIYINERKNQTMKRIIGFTLTTILILALLTSCGKKENSTPPAAASNEEPPIELIVGQDDITENDVVIDTPTD